MMRCNDIQFSSHAIQRMFERGLNQEAVCNAVLSGEVVADYADDKPYPSQLLLYFNDKQPLHVVVAYNREVDECIVVTTYVPLVDQWGPDFKTRKAK